MPKRLYEELLKRLGRGEDISDLVKNYNAYDIRDLGEQAAGQFAKDQYGVKTAPDLIPLFERPEELSGLNFHENPKLLREENAKGIYYPKDKKIVLNNAEDIATGLHELSHPYDERAHGFYNLTDALSGNKKVKGIDLGAKGLEAAEELNRGHFFKDDLKGFSQLSRMLKGDKLRGLALPALGAAGLGASLYSAGAKAAEGDIPGAVLKGAAAFDPSGIASAVSDTRDRLRMPSEQGVAASMQDINNQAHTQLGDYSPEDYSQPDDTLKLLRGKLYGK